MDVPNPPHLFPLDEQTWPTECRDILNSPMGALNIYRVMAHSPALLTAWQPFRDHIVLGSGLTPCQRELVVLRTAFRWKAAYEWAHHTARGRLAGLSDLQIRNAGEPLDPCSSVNEDQLIFAAADDLHNDGAIGPMILGRLHEHLGVAATLDLIATVGMYTSLGFLAKTYQVALESDFAHLEPDW
jgi:alkylhydroperoxidase family enzyme